MEFLVYLAWSVFFAVVARAFAPSNRPPVPEKAGIADVDAPTIDEGVSVPIFAGTVKLDGQNVSWFGGLSANPVTQQGVVTGYKYRLTTQLTFGFGPIDGIKEIRFEDNALSADQVAYSYTDEYIDAAINAPGLFGGDDKEGGVGGTIRFYLGNTVQTHDIESATLIGKITPAYRRIFYAVARNFYWGLSPRLKPLSVVAQRWPNQLGVSGGTHQIGEDANPVCFLFEVMTDPIWGAGEPANRFDLTAWRAAAVQAHAEGIGISLRFATADTVEQIIRALMKYVDGAIYEDPITGLYSLRLIRDMEGADFPVLDKTHLSRVSASRISWTELKNTVKVTFTDRGRNYETGGVQAQQSAALAGIGNITDMETSDLPGFHTGEAAAFAAKRLLRTLSYPLSKVQVVGDRSLAVLRPGMGFRLQWERPTLNATYRVQSIDFGTLESPGITIDAIEDAFSTDSNTFVVPPKSTWAPVDSLARPATVSFLMEQPYRWTQRDTRDVIYGAEAPSAAHYRYNVVYQGVRDPSANQFPPTGRLQIAIPFWDGPEITFTLPLTLPSDFQQPTQAQYDAGESLLLIDDELMAYRAAFDNGNGTVSFGPVTRAVLDTVPSGHSAGAVVWLLPRVTSRLALNLADDQAVTVGSLTATQTDDQTLGEETSISITTRSRAASPIVPGGLTINGSPFGVAYDVTPATMPLVLGWNTRSKTSLKVFDQLTYDQTAIPVWGGVVVLVVRDAESSAVIHSKMYPAYVMSSASTLGQLNFSAPSGRARIDLYFLDTNKRRSWATQTVFMNVGTEAPRPALPQYKTTALLTFDEIPYRDTATSSAVVVGDSSKVFNLHQNVGLYASMLDLNEIAGTQLEANYPLYPVAGYADGYTVEARLTQNTAETYFTVSAYWDSDVNDANSTYLFLTLYTTYNAGTRYLAAQVVAGDGQNRFPYTQQVISFVPGVPLGVQTHCAVTLDGSVLKLWLKGRVKATFNIGYNIGALRLPYFSTTIYGSAVPATANSNFIDDVRVSASAVYTVDDAGTNENEFNNLGILT